MTDNTPIRRLPRALLAGVSALLFAAVLLLLFSYFQVLAQPAAGNLEVSKSVDLAWPWARPDDYLTYTVHIANTGDSLVGTAWMTDPLPSEVSYSGGLTATTGSPGVASGVVTWTGSLAPSEAVTITFAVQVVSTLSENTRFTNTAEVTGAGSLEQASVGTMLVITPFEFILPILYRNYPPVPVLDPIPVPDENGSYVVSWELDSTLVDHYVLQESANANFSPVTREFTTTSHSQLVEDGTSYGYVLYYRVRADDGWGEGPWSNVESVMLVYYDDFSNPSSGWPDDIGKMYYDDDEFMWKYWRRGYVSGHYRFYIDPGGPGAWFYQPDALAPYQPPSNKYCVETSLKFERRAYWANMGLIFGANEANTDLYALCMSYASEQVSWFIVRSANYEFPKKACFGPKIAEGTQGTSVNGWNRLQVSVDGNQINVYVGGIHVAHKTMSGLSSTTRVGLAGGVYEVTPVDIRADYFKVIPNASCTP